MRTFYFCYSHKFIHKYFSCNLKVDTTFCWCIRFLVT
uniref:Uncharacterized protein n=1 Tax=Rhizophora mucronata TaxID=61149 RepID=A0A2P2QA25_RHIMU